MRDLTGFLAIHPMPLHCSKTPGRAGKDLRLGDLADAALGPPRPKASSTRRYIILEAVTGPQHHLSALHERRCRHPCKTRFRLAGSAFAGRASNPLGHDERFQVTSILLSRTSPVARVVYAKRPFGGPQAVLAYLSRYTHRVAIANSRIIAFNESGVTFKWKDYRAKQQQRGNVMTLAVDEFIRRFLIHVLPNGFHRIRHYGLFANGGRAKNIVRARQFSFRFRSAAATPRHGLCGSPARSSHRRFPALAAAERMIVIETFERGCKPRHQPTQRIRIDSS